MLRVPLLLALLLPVPPALADEPLEVLREHVNRGIAVLQDPRFADGTDRLAQREALCEIAHDMFDPHLFSKLALGANWGTFSETQRTEFVDALSDYLCSFYLSRLQERYSDESVIFVDQELRNDSLALVRVEVDWQNTRVPLEIRMARREGRWKAFDAVFMGVSVLLVYRTQLREALANGSPDDLIRDLRARLAANG